MIVFFTHSCQLPCFFVQPCTSKTPVQWVDFVACHDCCITTINFVTVQVRVIVRHCGKTGLILLRIPIHSLIKKWQMVQASSYGLGHAGEFHACVTTETHVAILTMIINHQNAWHLLNAYGLYCMPIYATLNACMKLVSGHIAVYRHNIRPLTFRIIDWSSPVCQQLHAVPATCRGNKSCRFFAANRNKLNVFNFRRQFEPTSIGLYRPTCPLWNGTDQTQGQQAVCCFDFLLSICCIDKLPAWTEIQAQQLLQERPIKRTEELKPYP